MIDMNVKSSRRGFILVEMMLAVLLLAVLFPVIYTFVFRELAKENRQLAINDESSQILFLQNTLSRLKNEAASITVAPDKLVFIASRDITTVTLKGKQIAQDNGVLRYLTIAPVEVIRFIITPETPNRLRLSVQTRRKGYDWVL